VLRLILWAWPSASEGLPSQLSEHLVLPCWVILDVFHDDTISLPARHTRGSTKPQLVGQVHKGIDLPSADPLSKLLAITLAIDQFMTTRHRPLSGLRLAGMQRLERPQNHTQYGTGNDNAPSHPSTPSTHTLDIDTASQIDRIDFTALRLYDL